MKENDKPIVIGCYIGKYIGGGVESVMMNYYRNIDKSKVQFDFICDSDSTNIPYEEIEGMGGRVILVPPYQSLFKFQKEFTEICRKNNYRILHSNVNALSVFPLRAAKKAGVPVRIAHSHSTSNKKEWKKTLIKNILRPFSKKYATDYFCCSELAGRWLFGDKEYNKGSVYIVNNAIDVEKFKYNEEIRKKVRAELNIDESTLVIGNVGRFMPQKNHDYLLDIYKEIYEENKDSILLLVGQGPLVDNIKQKAVNLGIDKNVCFLGQRDDVNELYQAFDAFVFPSLYEGLGMALIEAQCSGSYCLASTGVPKIAKVTDLLDFLDLSVNPKEWSKKILESVNKDERKEQSDKLLKSGYEIKNEAKKLEEKYLSYY